MTLVQVIIVIILVATVFGTLGYWTGKIDGYDDGFYMGFDTAKQTDQLPTKQSKRVNNKDPLWYVDRRDHQ